MMPAVLRRAAPVFLCLLLAPAGAPAAEDLSHFIDRVLAAYGDEAALRQTTVMRQRGQTYSVMRQHAGRIEREVGFPDRLRVRIDYGAGGGELRVLNGRQGWKDGQAVHPMLLEAMRLQLMRLALPLVLRDHRAAVQDGGTRAGPDGEQRILAVQMAPQLALAMAVDVKSGLIRTSTSTLLSGGRPAMQFSTVYSDFRRWNGVLVAGREDQYAMGRYIGFTQLEKVEFPASLPATRFEGR